MRTLLVVSFDHKERFRGILSNIDKVVTLFKEKVDNESINEMGIGNIYVDLLETAKSVKSLSTTSKDLLYAAAIKIVDGSYKVGDHRLWLNHNSVKQVSINNEMKYEIGGLGFIKLLRQEYDGDWSGDYINSYIDVNTSKLIIERNS